ncbi:MAG: small multi-drug export protein [Oscillospiraceae bacterium]
MLVKLLTLFVISMVPVIELRGAIPVGVGMGIPFWLNYLVCVLGNVILVPILIPCARTVLFWCAKLPKVGKYFQKIIDLGNRKIEKLGKYELLGIFLFVAIPLPGTGAWTGSLIATLLQLNTFKAFIAITLGVMAAGLIMGVLSFGLFGLLGI